MESSLRGLREEAEERAAVQELEERRAREGRAETLRASLRAVEASSGPKRKQGTLDSFLSPTPKKSLAEEPFGKFQGERGPKHPCTLSIRAQRLLDEKKKEQAEVVKALEEELKNERAKGTEAGREAARRQLEAVNSRCSTISLPDAPRKRGRPKKREAEKVAQAEFQKLRHKNPRIWSQPEARHANGGGATRHQKASEGKGINARGSQQTPRNLLERRGRRVGAHCQDAEVHLLSHAR